MLHPRPSAVAAALAAMELPEAIDVAGVEALLDPHPYPVVLSCILVAYSVRLRK